MCQWGFVPASFVLTALQHLSRCSQYPFLDIILFVEVLQPFPLFPMFFLKYPTFNVLHFDSR